MTRLLDVDLDARRALVNADGTFARLADGLAHELEPLFAVDIPVPIAKARLTRRGGRCERDGTLLLFDPYDATSHRCAQCGTEYRGRDHDDWWALGAQLWCAERAVHASALFTLRGDTRHRDLALAILAAFADRYDSYPNRDNVLGPSRPFFSTYLESIWTLNICHAIALLRSSNDAAVDSLLSRVCDRVVTSSAALIDGYHEGYSNRQVWNEAAVLASHLVLGREGQFAERAVRPGGLATLLANAMLDDGTWYEGENYHLFAHRGLWYGMEMLKASERVSGADLMARAFPDALVRADVLRRYRAGFTSPFAGVLPDDTLPSRRDSPYRVSIRQWRIAEHLELGWADEHDPAIAALLTRLYDSKSHVELQVANARWRSTADAERPEPPHRLSQESLSWRALLRASPELPPHVTNGAGSIVLGAQGLAVLRRERGNTYVALEGGHDGGGHGHPDRLALTLQRGAARWLEDPGTGSYVDPRLHWYRSTLAHHAPLIDGVSQRFGACTTLAFDDRAAAGWIAKRATDAHRGVAVERRIIASDCYVVDVLSWHADHEVSVTLPIATGDDDASTARQSIDESRALVWRESDPAGARRAIDVDAANDGFAFVRDARVAHVDANTRLDLALLSHWASDRAALSLACTTGMIVERGTVPGPPGLPEAVRTWVTCSASVGRIVSVIAWSVSTGEDDVAPRADTSVAIAPPRVRVSAVQLDPANPTSVAAVTTTDGTTAVHGHADHGWHIALVAGGATSSIDLEYADPALADGAILGVPRPAPRIQDVGAEGSSALHTARALDMREAPETVRVPLVWLDTADAALPSTALEFALGESHYRRTEQLWADAGRPAGAVRVARSADLLIVDVLARTGAPIVPHAGEMNAFDNERADVNADGAQWYVRHPDAIEWWDGGLLVAADGDTVGQPRATPLFPETRSPPESRIRYHDWGWTMRLAWRIDSLPLDDEGILALQVVINERTAERERRRGQLALAGGGGFAYLRGDREAVADARRLRLR